MLARPPARPGLLPCWRRRQQVLALGCSLGTSRQRAVAVQHPKDPLQAPRGPWPKTVSTLDLWRKRLQSPPLSLGKRLLLYPQLSTQSIFNLQTFPSEASSQTRLTNPLPDVCRPTSAGASTTQHSKKSPLPRCGRGDEVEPRLPRLSCGPALAAEAEQQTGAAEEHQC
jgi:hypothetical protein